MGGERLPGLGREPLLEQGGKWEEENELGRAPCRDAPPFIAAGSPSWGGGRVISLGGRWIFSRGWDIKQFKA